MNVQQVWLAQSSQAPRISLEYIRHRADSLERRTRNDAVLAYVVCISACGFWGGSPAPIFRLSR